MKVLGHLSLSGASERSVIVHDTPFADYLHHHKELQIALVYKGSGTMVIGNCVQQFSTGDIYIIGADQPHLFKSADGDPSNLGAIHIYLEYKTAFEGLLSMPEMEQIKRFLKNSDYGFKVPKRYTDTATQIIRKIKSSSGLDRLLETIQLLKFLVNVPRWKPLSTGLYNYSFDGTERLNSIYQYTMKHYHENISLNKIASVACMTPHAFCKYFKKHTLKTYLNFLNEYRIAEACKKLLSEDYRSVSAVAYATGFSNAITFNRVFKKCMSLTPTAYIDRFKTRESEMDIETFSRSA